MYFHLSSEGTHYALEKWPRRSGMFVFLSIRPPVRMSIRPPDFLNPCPLRNHVKLECYYPISNILEKVSLSKG